ncbi:hypothetical protein [Burkholderia ambifaria]|uniref:hypothetical protein n=1 Tax=Burkholderia ambifaria TaxID=152480 RepID=UPI0012FDF7D0|nr:hypothetical protein [Burkholderia ambifaria]
MHTIARSGGVASFEVQTVVPLKASKACGCTATVSFAVVERPMSKIVNCEQVRYTEIG